MELREKAPPTVCMKDGVLFLDKRYLLVRSLHNILFIRVVSTPPMIIYMGVDKHESKYTNNVFRQFINWYAEG